MKKTDKSLWCWGGSPFGYDWGFGTAVPHEYLTDVASAVLGTIDHICATKTDGSLWCWGHNGNGQVGVGSGPTDVGSPTQITGLANLKQVSLGYISSLALQNDGTLWTWGDGESGQLGVGSIGIKFIPSQITATAHFLQGGMGYNHACGTRSGGALWCWGDNTNGELGLGFTSTMYNTPVELTGFVGVSKLAVGSGYTCVLKTDGSVWCWGDNRWGELGLGDTTNRSMPTKLTF